MERNETEERATTTQNAREINVETYESGAVTE